MKIFSWFRCEDLDDPFNTHLINVVAADKEKAMAFLLEELTSQGVEWGMGKYFQITNDWEFDERPLTEGLILKWGAV